ncbi:MAG: hypothetical protein EOP56_14740 [Sphingobacteriales bacterium]|nr:MAG: hypothetical protein EOP56_14740 [Sphingobacteriales bacterium]
MNQVTEFFKKLFDTSDFPARWHCGNWSDFHGWLYITSELLIWSAYFAIPLIIIRYVTRKQKAVNFHPLYFLFASFILLCGTAHFIDAMIFWTPVYRISAILKLITGIVSWTAAIYLIRLLPVAFSYRTPKEMEEEIELRRRAQEELTYKNHQLQDAEQMAKICFWQWDIKNDTIEWSDSTYEIYDLPQGHHLNLEMFIQAVHFEEQEFVRGVIKSVLKNRQFPEFFCRIITPRKVIKHVFVKGSLSFEEEKLVRLNGTMQDVTEQREHLQQIQLQNERLTEIAWIQSHKVRGPVASILGLAQLFNEDDPSDPVNKEIVDKLKTATANLDNIIREINGKTAGLHVARTKEKVMP